MTYPSAGSNFPLSLSTLQASLSERLIHQRASGGFYQPLNSITHLPLCEQVNYQQASVTAYSVTYKLLFKVMVCDWEQNCFCLINSTKSIPLSREMALGDDPACQSEARTKVLDGWGNSRCGGEQGVGHRSKMLLRSSEILPHSGNHSKHNSG